MWTSPQSYLSLSFSEEDKVKSEDGTSEVVITEEMEQEEKQLMEEGERKEKEMMEQVCFAFFPSSCQCLSLNSVLVEVLLFRQQFKMGLVERHFPVRPNGLAPW